MGIAMSSPYGTSIHVTVTIDPRNEEAFLQALKPAFDAVCTEPGNTFFEVYKNSDKPGQFKFVENWNASKEWLIEVRKPRGDARVLLNKSTGTTSEALLQAIHRCHQVHVDRATEAGILRSDPANVSQRQGREFCGMRICIFAICQFFEQYIAWASIGHLCISAIIARQDWVRSQVNAWKTLDHSSYSLPLICTILLSLSL